MLNCDHEPSKMRGLRVAKAGEPGTKIARTVICDNYSLR
jgi:hypothetical protein